MAHRYDHPDGERTSGCMAIIVKDCMYCISVNLCSPLPVIALCMLLLDLCFTLCSVYLPPAIPVSLAYLTNLISQLPPPFILLGDFNARNILWGAVLTDKRGRSVYDVCAGFDLILLNTGAHTHLYLGSGTLSTLDLAFCSPGLAVQLDWSVLPDLHGSDLHGKSAHLYTISNSIETSEMDHQTCQLGWFLPVIDL
jgi:hypothetical protein